MAGQFFRPRRLARLLDLRRHLGLRISRRIFPRRLGRLSRRRRRNFLRIDSHLDRDLAVVAGIGTAAVGVARVIIAHGSLRWPANLKR
jgi:hypothetical protein